jgi:hypothetical protein
LIDFSRGLAAFARPVGCTLLLVACVAQAQLTRPIPTDSKVGRFVGAAPGLLRIDSSDYALSPAASLRDASNLIVQGSALPEESVVRFVLDEQGQLTRLWVLNDEEQSRIGPRRMPGFGGPRSR